MPGPPLLATDLADLYRRIYRAQFKADVAAGNKVPFLLHLVFWGVFILPILYLSIPHKRRPWLYHARWIVLALCTMINAWVIRNVASSNFAFSYGTGICAAWGTVWNFTVLVWTRPQWDARRIERYPNPRYQKLVEGSQDVDHNDATSILASGSDGTLSNGHSNIASRKLQNQKIANGQFVQKDVVREEQKETRKMISYLEMNMGKSTHNSQLLSVVDFDRLNKRQPFIYKWQSFPEDAPFLKRLDWAFDIGATMRLTGWNWAIHVLPPYRPPPWFDETMTYQMPLHFLPDSTRQGYTRCRTRMEFLRNRILFGIVPCYLLVDICATIMTQDPYFILGPNDLPLSAGLGDMSPFLLSLRRTLLSFVAVIVALRLAWDFGAVLLALLGPPVIGFRADPWHLPSMTGSFMQVLDRGLAGFWGSWWHQTFRFGFAAPTEWMIRNGYIEKGSTPAAVVGALVAFVTSGFLHAMGSYTTIPKTHWWEPPVFFFLSGVGTQLQSVLSKKFRKSIGKMPRFIRRAGNLLFTFAWLHLTCKFLLDDFGRCGIWLWEPIPFSFARWLGYGIDGASWWRWTNEDNPHWLSGRHWWDTGIGI
ncbi:membrane bound O-acyl transferase family-domain-containing protein [Truncatella angustata]|uniref:Membrane bound O-acyl transferase family-domain-containing protein n=1 Tax=Truncatella angustata TaxID=152316 RepID=A0A9P9A480_9PEZI|nr:membrane bound O-acyl transferase family-domain-containing protein [Truncatella angustata]KAH6660020.1 membrane bound O-acyl transferase family-domain-containing protein [Truncatella angustata]